MLPTSNTIYYFVHSENPDGLQDWGIVELQGDLEVRGNQIMSGQFIGDLCFDKYGKPVCTQLIIPVRITALMIFNKKKFRF